MKSALLEGHQSLMAGATALIVVENAIRLLEKSGLFNAGLGANHQLDGIRRMDASIMEGRSLQGGAVASIEGIIHPITAARLVMEQTGHVLLVGPPASRFARHFALEQAPRVSGVATSRATQSVPQGGLKRMVQLHQAMLHSGRLRRRTRGKETVGAVALDVAGTVAAGASTGGVDAMLPGRVGDTPLIGCGVYADNESGAISMTGLGEGIIRIAVAKEISNLLENGVSPLVSANRVLRKLVRRIDGAAGVLVVSADGRFAIRHSTPRMLAGSIVRPGVPEVHDRFA
jgi:L-asparaginase / beta-aspartyl-peptidase